MPIWSRLRNRWRERSLGQDFEDEIRFHLDTRTDANVRRGMGRLEAETEARRSFGNIVLAREGMREARVAGWPDDLARDVRHAVRVFRRQPFLTGLTVLTLSLGIGANAAIFSLLNAALLRRLPFPSADRLVSLVDRNDQGRTGPTIPEVLDIRDWSTTLDGVSFFDTRDFQIDGGSEPARVFGARVEPAFLSIVGARPALGRLFSGSDGSVDGSAGGEPVVVLSDGLWRRNFGADPAAIGRRLAVNGVSHVIVGLLPPEFGIDILSSEPVDMYVPYPMIPAYTSRTEPFTSVRRVFAIAQIKPGVPMTSASSELGAMANTLVRQHPELYRSSGDGDARTRFAMDVEPLHDSVTRGSRPVLLMLCGAVALVLLIACVNAAQFLVAQAIEREPEVALRRALGASRGRLLRQFLSETLLLAVVATAFGLLQAFWLVRALRALLSPGLRVVGQIEVDLPVLAFTAAVAVATLGFCGLVPGLRFSRGLAHAGLGTRSVSSRGRSRQIFIGIEVALSLVLLVQAGLLLRSLQVLQREQAGFSADAVTVMRMRGMGGGGALGDPFPRYLTRIGALPDIQAVALTSAVLPGRPGMPFDIIGRAHDPAALAQQNASYLIVSPGYFSVLQIPIREGRPFSDDDTAGRPAVAIVNEAFARQYWPGESAVGRQIHSGVGPRAATMTIVGVVGNVRPVFQTGDVPQIYVSYRQQGEPNAVLMLRTRAGAGVPIQGVKEAIWSIEPRQAVFSIRPLREILSQSIQGQRIIAALIGAFALLAFVMSVAGIFTVVSYLTSRRVREIALRRAIGARDSDVLWLLAAPTFRWTIAGMFAGAAGAVLAEGVLRAAVAGVVRIDASIVTVVGGAYLAIVAVAMTLPALRALRVDPSTILRSE
jgi:putative ABC transport system permease protein